MTASLHALLPLFEQERAAGRALTLGVVVSTTGSTYGKTGTLIAFSQGGTHAGMISGGCLEGDLCEHAQRVIASAQAQLVQYDLNDAHESLWGLNGGCGGTIHILLLRVGPENNWQPLNYFAQAFGEHRAACAGIVCASDTVPLGSVVLPGKPGALPALESVEVHDALARTIREGRPRWLRPASRAFDLVTIPLALPPRVLILGGGADSLPVVDFATRLGWKVTLIDHRPAYADPARFPAAEKVVQAAPTQLARVLDLSRFAVAIVMSHHFNSDAVYLRALASTQLGYIGLLGPTTRRDRLLTELGEDVAASLEDRLRAPVGLSLGGRGPESIALSIVAEVHAYLHTAVATGAAAGGVPHLPPREMVEAC